MRRRRWLRAATTGDNGEVVDDEARVNDEVADLDGDELRRVASLAGRRKLVRSVSRGWRWASC